MIHNFKDLIVWQKSMALVERLYALLLHYPTQENYGLTSQIQRSAVSIPANIAEGSGRNSDKEFSRFLSIALGSSFELETEIILSQKVGYISQDDFESLNTEILAIQKMIYSLQQKLI